jgi:hypothetical protein
MRETPFLKLTAISADAKQSGLRESLVLVVVLVLDHLNRLPLTAHSYPLKRFG